MINTLKVNYTNHTIVMDRTFAKLAQDTRSDEYARLQAVRKDYPTFTVVQRSIRKNSDKKTYQGLTYSRMMESDEYAKLQKEFDDKREAFIQKYGVKC